MADTKPKHSTLKRQFSGETDSLSLGAARQRHLRRLGSDRESQPIPVITPRPRREVADAQSARPRRVKRVTHSTASSGGMPPVMARGGMQSMASRKPRRSQPKRRFDIPLRSLVAEAPGAEVRLPALPSLQLGGRAISGAIVVMLIACLVFIWKSPAFHISEVQTTGLQRLTTVDVSTALGVQGDWIFQMDSRALEENLQAIFPELKDIRVRISLPGKLEISAVERTPVIAWTQGDQELWVDAEGVSFLQRGSVESALVQVKAQSAPAGSLPAQAATEQAAPLPGALLNAAPQMRLSPDLVSAILAMSSVAPQDTTLLYNAEHGMGWNDKQYGWKVFFGDEIGAIDQKLLVYQALAARLSSDGIQPVLVSVEFLHAPYYRMEK